MPPRDALWKVIANAGIDVTDPPGVRLQRRVIYASDGSLAGKQLTTQLVSSWDAIYRLLLPHLPGNRYRQGCNVTGAATTQAGVVIHIEGGANDTADLAVAADGTGSTLRSALLPALAPAYAGYVAWRGLVEEAALDASTRDALVDCMAFCTPPGEQMLAYTVPGGDDDLRPGHRRQNFVWYCPAPADTVLRTLLTGRDGQVYTNGIPPPAIREEVIAAMRADAERLLSPAFAALVRATAQPFIQPIHDLCSPRLAFGQIALVGDAAILARPHVGAGTTKAMQDAAALAASLARTTDVPAALQDYERARLGPGRRLYERSRWLGTHLAPGSKESGQDQAPETLLGHTALPVL